MIIVGSICFTLALITLIIMFLIEDAILLAYVILFSLGGTIMMVGHVQDRDRENYIKALRKQSSLNVTSASPNNATITCNNTELHVPVQFVEDKKQLTFFTSSTSFVILDKTNIDKFFPYGCVIK